MLTYIICSYVCIWNICIHFIDNNGCHGNGNCTKLDPTENNGKAFTCTCYNVTDILQWSGDTCDRLPCDTSNTCFTFFGTLIPYNWVGHTLTWDTLNGQDIAFDVSFDTSVSPISADFSSYKNYDDVFYEPFYSETPMSSVHREISWPSITSERDYTLWLKGDQAIHYNATVCVSLWFGVRKHMYLKRTSHLCVSLCLCLMYMYLPSYVLTHVCVYLCWCLMYMYLTSYVLKSTSHVCVSLCCCLMYVY